ncbi:MAG: GNAT family N-acetyltransferase [Actinomycetota bacterium]|nr:GNAT family N-acetyltransferase [Actinomycetota bacterium]
MLTLVALDHGDVVGFTQAPTDGEIQAYLCVLIVAAGARHRGIGRRLLSEVLVRSGAERLDVLAADGTQDFYRSVAHLAWDGFRITRDLTSPRG